MRKFRIAVAFAVLSVAAASFSACDVTSGNTFASPSGAVVNRTKCSHSSDACFQAASATCAGPYQVIESESHPGRLLEDAMPGPVTWYSMTYQCGPSDGKMPTFALRGGATINETSTFTNSSLGIEKLSPFYPGGCLWSSYRQLENHRNAGARIQRVPSQTGKTERQISGGAFTSRGTIGAPEACSASTEQIPVSAYGRPSRLKPN